ncbi:MAG: hypothetical protein ACRD8O_05700 [Bryobacteraceae bacterium]
MWKLACGLLILGLPVFGSGINASQTHYIFIPTNSSLPSVNEVASPIKTLTYNNPANGNPATVTGTGTLAAAGLTLGAGSSIDLSNAAAGQYDVISDARYDDIFQLPNLGFTVITIQWTFQLEGTFQLPSPNFGNSFMSAGGGCSGATGGVFLQPSSSSSFSQTVVTTNVIQLFGDPNIDRCSFSESVRANTDLSFSGATPVTAFGAVNFASTMRLTNIAVFGPGGLLPNAQILDSSGQSPLGTPEPSSAALVAVGFFALWHSLQRKSRGWRKNSAFMPRAESIIPRINRCVFRLSSLILLVSSVTPRLSAAPTITSVANAASNLTFNSPLSQGAIFVIKGSGLGPANISIAPAAFQSTTLSNTSVAVTVGTTTVNAPMYYTSEGQVAALLPSNTPTGTGIFTVTYNGQTSSPFNRNIAVNNLGIFTIDSSGQGPGIVTYADYSLVSAAKAANCGAPSTACGAANPGDTLILWGTGLGPVSGNDASGAGLGQPMPNVPLKLWLGGVQTPVSYQGRSGCCIGEDQIVFTVPNNVSLGCAVPLVVQIGDAANTISNSTVMPVANGSRSCTASNTALASVDVEQLVMAGPVTFGDIQLRHDLNGVLPPVFQDNAEFTFLKILSYTPGTQPFLNSWFDDQPPGTCIVYNNLNRGGDIPIPESSFGALNAGSSFTVRGPNGSVPVAGTAGQFSARLSVAGTFLVPGVYSVTGTGGADVGPFSATITIPATPALVSPVNNAMVTRSSGLTVTWTGGGPNGNVVMIVTSATDNTYNNAGQAICLAPASAGTFTIPPYVLLALPAGNFAGFVFAPAGATVPFTATGLNLGSLSTHSDGTGFGYGAGTGSFALR